MNLIYYRTGFASNSSSMHSTWHVDDIQKVRERIDGMEFGWESFVCSSRLGIQMYFAAQLASQLSSTLYSSVPPLVIAALIKFLYPKIKESWYYNRENDSIEAYIDHESVWWFPKDFYSNNSIFPSFRFIKDVEEYLIRTNGVIVGGNDNEEGPDIRYLLGNKNPQPDHIIRNTFHSSDISEDPVCLKDGEVWKIFDRKNGRKIRFSFNDHISYEKSSEPELVDLIISNKCSHNCPYCYRGCTSSGEEANIGMVRELIRNLTEHHSIFEIAIGGGNIVEYKDLEKLCDEINNFHKFGIKTGTVFNTTINWKDFKVENLDRLKLIFSSFRGIAVSVSNIEEADKVFEFMDMHKIQPRREQMTFQCIPELMKYEDIVDLVQQKKYAVSNIPLRVTFLGFKQTGRGNSSQYSASEFEKNKDEFRKFIKNSRKIFAESSWWIYSRVCGIDTQLISNFPELKETQEKWAYTEEEGKFSCCIDAVSGYILPSSYSEYKDEYKVSSVIRKKWFGEDESDLFSAALKKLYPKF